MATQITNQATLTYTYGTSTGTAVSNIATATLQGALAVTKSSLFSEYRVGDSIVYTLTLTNNSDAPLTAVTATDDLGTYELGTVNVTPLTYVGPASLSLNGVPSGAVTPVVGADSVEFTLATLAANTTATISYLVTVNDTAEAAADSDIVNTVTATYTGATEPVI